MFQLIDWLITSPMGVFVIAKAHDLIFAVVSDCDECGFNDLGKLLFGGLAVAILVGIVVSIVFRKMKDKHDDTNGFISIQGTPKKQ